MKRCWLSVCILNLLLAAACTRAISTLTSRVTLQFEKTTVAPTPLRSPTLTPRPTVTPRPTLTPHPTPAGSPDVIIDPSALLTDGPIAYGTNGWWTDQDADLWQARYAELGPQIVRLPLIHQFLEPTNDDADPAHVSWEGFGFDKALPWSGRTITYRRWFETLCDLNVTLMLYPPHLAGWLSANGNSGPYSTYPPASVEEYREFIQATLTFLVEQLNYPPDRIILEPVNEPDLRCGQDPAVPCFWEQWTMDDLAAVVQAARQAADAVDPAIRLAGLSTCCDHELVSRLMQDHDGATLLDELTFHRYEPGFDQSAAIQIGERYKSWGLPVYINEYGSPRYWSDGQAGALWHAAALAQIWPQGLAPLQFAISEFPGMHEGYNRLGLFADWTNDWEPKPAYAVYVGFSRHLGPSVPVSTTAQAPLIVMAGRINDESTTVWIVNADQADRPGVVFQARNFPVDGAVVTVYDVLAGLDPVDTFAVAGTPLAWSYDLPAGSVHAFEISACVDH